MTIEREVAVLIFDVFGFLWDHWSSGLAFDFGALVAVAAAAGLALVVPGRQAAA